MWYNYCIILAKNELYQKFGISGWCNLKTFCSF